MLTVWVYNRDQVKSSRMALDINTKGKNLFLTLATVSLVLLMIITTLLWWFISPRLHEINEILANLSLTALRIFYVILIFGTVLVYLTCFLEKNFIISNFAVRLFIRVIFPVTVFLGKLVGIGKDKIRESFVHVNNSFTNALKKKFDPKKVLILLPHCLQHTSCGIRITVNVDNCARCGKCNIGELCQLADKYNLKMYIATGGTLARKIIIENKPSFIIAVACQRDLVEGIKEVFPIPVFGVLNQRPEGPCVNTKVDVSKIEKTLQDILKNEKKR